MVTKTQAIKTFLHKSTIPDLADLYHHNMECQVNVAQDGGERIDGEFKGRQWHGWTDGVQTWKSFRIPYKAYSEPEYKDSKMSFDLAQHVEAIGMTGWDWKNRVSKWVAYDYDALVGHSDKHVHKLSNAALEEVKKAAFDIDWVSIRKSTSGKGLHLYVYLDDVPTANHHEHAALARTILGTMSAITGFDFLNKVDICGGNMWVWARKMQGTEGLLRIKEGSLFEDIPINWRDHIDVVKGNRQRNLPQDIEPSSISLFETVTSQHPVVQLDADHKKVINLLKDNKSIWWWDQDRHMLVTHTKYLKDIHVALNLKGVFETTTNASSEQNCFLFPMRNGSWTVRRFSPGVNEHPSWQQDGQGWTQCFLNRDTDIITACKSFQGLEDPSGGFIFREAEVAMTAAKHLGVTLDIGTPLLSRETKIKQHKDGRVVAEVERHDQDRADEMEGWLPKGKKWVKIFNAQNSNAEREIGNYDDLIRHLVTVSDEDSGWVIKTDNLWRNEPLHHIKAALSALGYGNKEVTSIVGSSIFQAWKLVNKPFQPEYTGNREWNRDAAQLRYMPKNPSEQLNYPTWRSLLKQCGTGLDSAVLEDNWCKANGILSGGDYLKCWVASLFQFPDQHLPYLFFYSREQDTGKSTFHEALELLLTKGYVRADHALVSQGNFNGELLGAIICVVEETDLGKNKLAYNRIKDWVTSRKLSIHEKRETPYHIINTTHWIQCANDHKECPIFAGDTRIVISNVPPIDPINMIPKKKMISDLANEASDFLTEILNLEVPYSPSRLNVPVVSSPERETLQILSMSALDIYIKDHCLLLPGRKIKFSDFYDSFLENVDPMEANNWSKIKVGRDLPPEIPKGRIRETGQFFIGNIWWKDTEVSKPPENRFILKEGYLIPIGGSQ